MDKTDHIAFPTEVVEVTFAYSAPGGYIKDGSYHIWDDPDEVPWLSKSTVRGDPMDGLMGRTRTKC